jgi:ABC-2 type transport system permease protein
MRYLKLIASFVVVSAQGEFAYSANFWTGLMHTLINVATAWLGLTIVFGQVETVGGWSYGSALAVLGCYLVVGAVRDLVISPSLDRLAGLDGDLWRGTFDFVLLRPINTQFLVSLREWRLLSLFDLLLGIAVLALAATQLGPAPVTTAATAATAAASLAAAPALSLTSVAVFAIAFLAGLLILYAVFLAFTSLMFWSPGFLFTWVFNGIFQMARYPVGIYPGFLRGVLTWVIPIGLMTTFPARALAGDLPPALLAAAALFSLLAFAGASLLFRKALTRYASASS